MKKPDTLAKRRDCVALLLGLPVRLPRQKELVEVGLAAGEPRYAYSKYGRGACIQQVQLTLNGRALALRALVEAPGSAWHSGALRGLRAQLRRTQQGGVLPARKAAR